MSRWHALGLATLLMTSAQAQESVDDVKIVILRGNDPVEGRLIPFYARVDWLQDEGVTPPLESRDNAYEPLIYDDGGQLAPTRIQPDLEYIWDFGDGTVVNTGHYPNASHRYADEGDSATTLTLTVRAVDESWSQTVEKSFDLKNKEPRRTEAAAVEVEPSRFELSAAAWDAEDDRGSLTYNWAFSTGGTAEGQTVTQTFLTDATAKLTITDPDGGTDEEDVEIRVSGAALHDPNEDEDEQEPPPPDERLEPSHTGLDVQLSGSYSGRMQAEVRPFAGQFLGPTGDTCRLMLTTWDPALLGVMTLIIDLPFLPEEEEDFTWQRVVPAAMSLGFIPEGEDFGKSYSKNDGGLSAGLGALAAMHGESAAEGQEAETGMAPGGDLGQMLDFGVDGMSGLDAIGLKSGEREPQFWEDTAADPPELKPYGSPVSRSPATSEDEGLGVENHGQAVRIRMVPRDFLVIDFANTTLDDPDSGNAITLNGKLSLDLENAQRDGLVRYEQCGYRPGDFTVEDVSPNAEAEGLSRGKVMPSIEFSQAYDPRTATAANIQLTYPPVDGDPIPVEVQLVRAAEEIHLWPTRPLKSGVTYTIRVRGGPQGVQTRHGTELDANQPIVIEQTVGEDLWWTSEFSTAVDLESSETAGLGCHTYQTVREAPLILDKPAVARVEAWWKPDPHVARSAQVRAFESEVRMPWFGGDAASVEHTFRYTSEHVDKSQAEHTADLIYEPIEAHYDHMQAVIAKGGDVVLCPAVTYPDKPVLRVEQHLLAVNSWMYDAGALSQAEARARAIASQAEDLAEQLYPFHEVEIQTKRTLKPRANNGTRSRFQLYPASQLKGEVHSGQTSWLQHVDPKLDAYYDAHPDDQDDLWACPTDIVYEGVSSSCPQRVLQHLSRPAPATDVVVGWQVGHGGGGMKAKFGHTHTSVYGPRTSGLGVVVLDMADEVTDDRLAIALVHEIGHALGLEHRPYIDQPPDGQSAVEITQMQDARGDGLTHHYQGIEAIAMSADGDDFSVRSSTDGNSDGEWLVPLMWGIGMDPWLQSMPRDQYLQILQLIEKHSPKFED